MKIALYFLAIFVLGVSAQADEAKHSHTSEYAGEEKRSIKGLSSDDIAELRRGGGWGLAKTAELNGVPGPAHLLEMKNQIPLSDDQILAIDEIYKQMKTQAILQGERLIALEGELERLFRSGSVTQDGLRSSLNRIAEARTQLRFTHLATHLKTSDILTRAQIGKYNELRGYSNPSLHADVPAGHGAEMRHKPKMGANN
ncbi:hypothetical protein MNBD_ALPHA09-577 [hydrothermal vent metagenome]|uniref:Periplasmic heavy metal sensor n=1 Tax=hydrothermal vent metagenome TaxID=652676 RepID=A0A3B0TKB8_9ZZZZ